MNDWFRRPPCGCGRQAERPERPVPDWDGKSPPFPPCHEKTRDERPQYGNCYLMQRILASGRMYRRRQSYPLCLCDLPPEAVPPFTVLETGVCGPSVWETCDDRRQDRIRVTVPLSVRIRDGCGRVYMSAAQVTETLCLTGREPPESCWRGQIFVQAAVRLAGRVCPCEKAPCQVPLEVLIEGYILSPCTVGCPENPPCPPSRPWYPRPMFDPYNG